jgi:hypothetical protein
VAGWVPLEQQQPGLLEAMHIHMALSRQIPCTTAVAFRILELNLVAGVHVHMNYYSGWLGSARTTTAKTAGGNAHPYGTF